MSQNRQATVCPVEESQATGKVAEIFADIRKVKGTDKVARFWRVLATQSDLLEMTWSRLKTVMHPEAVGRVSPLDARTREIIAVAVSATNGCSYCVNSHTAALERLGVTPEILGEVMAVVALFNTTNALADGYQVAPDVFPSWGQ